VQRDDGTLYEQLWNNPATRSANVPCQVAGNNVYFLDSGGDGHTYLKYFDARPGMASAVTQVCMMSTGVASMWFMMGGASGSLGMPVGNPGSDTSPTAGAYTRQQFQGGWIVSSAVYGTHAITGAIFQKWSSLSDAQIGMPIGDAVAVGTMTYQLFERGI